ncbi:MAG: cation diffusion facilitator family transporter [Pseudomonadota bacterium]
MTPTHYHTHNHHDQRYTPLKLLSIAIALTLSFAIVEALTGLWAGSLTLLGDAGHMASDSVALAIAAFAAWLAQKPPSPSHSYGLGRAEVIAAWISSILLVLISIAIIIEAIERIHTPIHVKGNAVIIVAFLGLVINLFIAWLLTQGSRTLNIRAALLHVLSDVLGSIAALISGIVIYFTHWYRIDPLLSIIIGILIMISSFRLLRESLSILMEGVPATINITLVNQDMIKIKGVKAIHDLHIWTLSSGRIALSAHVNIADLSVWKEILIDLKRLLESKYHIKHITLQPEPEVMACKPCSE